MLIMLPYLAKRRTFKTKRASFLGVVTISKVLAALALVIREERLHSDSPPFPLFGFWGSLRNSAK